MAEDTTEEQKPTPEGGRQEEQYEFNTAQNEVIGQLAARMSGLKAPLLLFAVVQFIMGVWLFVKHLPEWGVMVPVLSGLIGAFSVAMAMLIKDGSKEIQLIVDTEGADIDHLMNGLSSIKKFYSYAWILASILTAVLCIAIYFSVNSLS